MCVNPPRRSNKTLIIHGAGRLSSIIASFKGESYEKIYRFVDYSTEANQNSEESHGRPSIIYELPECGEEQMLDYVSSIGYNNMLSRKEAYRSMARLKTITPINVIHQNAYISPHADIGVGNIFFPGVIVEPGVTIGDNNIIWSNTVICHDSTIGSHSFIAASSVIGGFSRLGDSVFLGFGSIVNDNLNVCSHSFLASGSVLTKSISVEGSRLCGVPAKPMNRQPSYFTRLFHEDSF